MDDVHFIPHTVRPVPTAKARDRCAETNRLVFATSHEYENEIEINSPWGCLRILLRCHCTAGDL
jgi:hypothetical protein